MSHGAFAVPTFLDPILGSLHEIAGRHHRVDQLHGLGATDTDLLALEQELQSVGWLQHPRDTLCAAAAREQADLDLRQAEPCLIVVGGDAVMAGQRQLEAAADRGTIDRGDPRLATRLDPTANHRQLAAFLEEACIRRRLALRRHQFGISAAQRFEHGEIGTGAECVLAGCDDGAL